MAGELGGTAVAGQAVQVGPGVHGGVRRAALWCPRPEETAHPGAAGTRSAMKTLRRTLLVLAPVAALGLLAAGIASAQSQPPSPPQSSQDADKAEAGKRRQDEAAKAEAARKAEARKPKRDKSGDRKDPERELEEEEDI